MSKYRLSARSKRRLVGVHPDLAAVVERAIATTNVDFAVLEGLRTKQRQEQLVRKGASKTMNSLHLRQVDGYSHAVDLGAYLDGRVRWDWPLYYAIADAMSEAAAMLGTPLEWGGDWKTFKDGPHFQLPRGYSPA